MTVTQSATATASKVAIGIALGASAAFAAVSLNDLFDKNPPSSGEVMPYEGGAILTREMCWQGCEETYRMCGGGETGACRIAFDACAESCLAYPPAETLPGYVPPGYIPPAEVVPGYAMPGYIVPGYEVPGYMTPGYVPPPPMGPRADFCVDRCVAQRSACLVAGRPSAFCEERLDSCFQACPLVEYLPPGYIPPAPRSACQYLCDEQGDLCHQSARSNMEHQMCLNTALACDSRCRGISPEAPMPTSTKVDPLEPMIEPPINTRPPEYVNDNPPDPIMPNIDTTDKPQEFLNQEEPKAEAGFFDKVWDFFAGDKKE